MWSANSPRIHFASIIREPCTPSSETVLAIEALRFSVSHQPLLWLAGISVSRGAVVREHGWKERSRDSAMLRAAQLQFSRLRFWVFRKNYLIERSLLRMIDGSNISRFAMCTRRRAAEVTVERVLHEKYISHKMNNREKLRYSNCQRIIKN